MFYTLIQGMCQYKFRNLLKINYILALGACMNNPSPSPSLQVVM